MISTDEHGRAIGFRYHDGALDGVLLENDGKVVILRIRASDGPASMLTLLGVRACVIDDFREGNIVGWIGLHRIHDDAALGEQLASWVSTRLHLDRSRLPSTLFVFFLESSYGARIVAVCEDVTVAAAESK